MKQTLLTTLTLFILLDCIGQTQPQIILPANQKVGYIKNIDFGCGYNKDFKKSEIEITYPEIRHVDEIKKILSYSGLPLNFEIFGANIENAVALII